MTARKLLQENLFMRTLLSNIVTDMERALPFYGAGHLTETKYFCEAREIATTLSKDGLTGHE
jgi:hypothetical protein